MQLIFSGLCYVGYNGQPNNKKAVMLYAQVTALRPLIYAGIVAIFTASYIIMYFDSKVLYMDPSLPRTTKIV